MSDFEPRVLSPDSDPAFPDGLPKGMKYEDSGHELAFSWRWFSKSLMPLMIFTAIWCSFVGLFVATAGWAILGAGIIHVGVGIGLGFYCLRQLVNRTHVRVAPGELTVKSGPIFGRDHVLLNPLSLKQLYVRRRSDTRVNGRPIHRYEVHAIINDVHDDVLVVGNLAELDQAHWIEGQIERYLEISEKRVPGSMPRPTPAEPIDQGNIINPPLIDPDRM